MGTSSREPCRKPEHPRCLSGSSQQHPPAHLQVRPACPFYHHGQPCPALTGTPSPWEHSCLGQDGLQAEHQGLTSPEPGGCPPTCPLHGGPTWPHRAPFVYIASSKPHRKLPPPALPLQLPACCSSFLTMENTSWETEVKGSAGLQVFLLGPWCGHSRGGELGVGGRVGGPTASLSGKGSFRGDSL